MLTEKIVREKAIGAALQLAEAMTKRGKKPTAIELRCFNALVDSAEVLLRESFPRDLEEFIAHSKRWNKLP